MARRRHVPLEGALVLVTGAGSGIGRETALAFARRGARLIAVDLDGGAAATTAADCGAAGAKHAEAHVVDVADVGAMTVLAELVHRDHGALDVLVNNAGVGMSGPFLDTSLDDWDWILGINLRGVVTGCKLFGEPMVAVGRGHVVNVSSGLGYTPRATEPAYVTTKAGVLALSQCLRADWGPRGVGVSVICPGVVNTPIVHRTRYRGGNADPKRIERVQKLFRRRNYPPTKVAAAIVRAVEKNRGIVAVSPEAKLGWLLHRLAPSWLRDRLARESRIGV